MRSSRLALLSYRGAEAWRREDTRVTEAERRAEVSGSHQKQAGWRGPAAVTEEDATRMHLVISNTYTVEYAIKCCL